MSAATINNKIITTAIHQLNESGSPLARLESSKDHILVARSTQQIQDVIDVKDAVEHRAKIEAVVFNILIYKQFLAAHSASESTVVQKKILQDHSAIIAKAPHYFLIKLGEKSAHLFSKVKTAADLERSPDLLNEIASIWNDTLSSTEEYAASLHSCKQLALARLMHSYAILPEDFAVYATELGKGQDESFQMALCTFLTREPLHLFHHFTALRSKSSHELDWLHLFLTTPTLDGSRLNASSKKLLQELAKRIGTVHKVLDTSELQSSFTDRQLQLLHACAVSQRVIFKLPEMFAKQYHLLFCRRLGTSLEQISTNISEDALRTIPFTLTTGAIVALNKKFKQDIDRRQGSIVMVQHLPSGNATTILLPQDVRFKNQHELIDTFLTKAANLSPHKVNYDESFSNLLQLYLSQEGFGLRYADALFYCSTEHNHGLKNNTLSTEIHDFGDGKIEIHYVLGGQVGMRDPSASKETFGNTSFHFKFIFNKNWLGNWIVRTKGDPEPTLQLDPAASETYNHREWTLVKI